MIEIHVANGIPKLAKRLATAVKNAFVKEMRKQSAILTRHIITRHLTGGTTEDRLRVRSGQLRRTTRPIPAKIEGDAVVGGTQVGVEYAKVHIGPVGKRTVIRPRSAKFLTVPLPAAMTPAGVLRARAKDIPGLFPIKSRKGNVILVKRAGKKKGVLIPMFVLKRQVTVPARVHPEKIIADTRPGIVEGFKKALQTALDSLR